MAAFAGGGRLTDLRSGGWPLREQHREPEAREGRMSWNSTPIRVRMRRAAGRDMTFVI